MHRSQQRDRQTHTHILTDVGVNTDAKKREKKKTKNFMLQP